MHLANQPYQKPSEMVPGPSLIWELPKIRGTLFWGPSNKDPTI